MGLKGLANHYSLIMLVSLAFVFAWFGISEIMSPIYWSGYIPPFVASLLPFNVNLFVQMHGVVLVLLALSLVFKFYIRYAGLLALGVLLSIISGLIMVDGFNEIVVRDIGLFGLALAIWLQSFSSNR